MADCKEQLKSAFFGSEGMVVWLSGAVKRAKEKNLETFLDLMRDTVGSSKTVVKSTVGKAKKMAAEIGKEASSIAKKKDMNPKKVAALLKKARQVAKIAPTRKYVHCN